MGLIRKIASASTLGGVKYTSRREAETKERLANARVARIEVKIAQQELASARVQAALDGTLAAWRLNTGELLQYRKLRKLVNPPDAGSPN